LHSGRGCTVGEEVGEVAILVAATRGTGFDLQNNCGKRERDIKIGDGNGMELVQKLGK
jgi:hypothetical protein